MKRGFLPLIGITMAVVHQTVSDKLTFPQANHLVSFEHSDEERAFVINRLFQRQQIDQGVREQLINHYGL